MRFSLGFWEKMKEFDITQMNIQDKLNDDYTKNALLIVLYGIYYGTPLETRPASVDQMEINVVDIKESLDPSVIDAIEETFIEGMSKAQKKLVEQAKKLQDSKIEEFGDAKKK